MILTNLYSDSSRVVFLGLFYCFLGGLGRWGGLCLIQLLLTNLIKPSRGNKKLYIYVNKQYTQ